MHELEITSPAKGFEEVKRISKDGIEYWHAREIMPLLGYDTWRSFDEVIKKAKRACMASGQVVENHFVDVDKMVKIGSNATRTIIDYKLDRYACYLIAQNGDSTKKEQIALAQTYFAIQTRKHEIFQNLARTEKRLLIRKEMIDQNKKLFSTARRAGVEQFGLFNDAGYRGLYGAPLLEVERRKGIKKGELLDRAGSTELAANLFRVTQTEEKLRKDVVSDQGTAVRTHFMVGGKVRQTIKDIGGELPENLKPEKHIRLVEKELKALDAYEETMKKIGHPVPPKNLARGKKKKS
jgi:DNA-damage-inducible protein D